jgi:hypothetical protein
MRHERRRRQPRVFGAAGGVVGCGQMRSWVSGFLSFVLKGCLPRPCQRYFDGGRATSTAPITTIPRAADDEIDDDGAPRTHARRVPSPWMTLPDDDSPLAGARYGASQPKVR